MEYARELPGNATQEQVDAAVEHVRDHLASIADGDDDPSTCADDVVVEIGLTDGKIWVKGWLDAEPDAPYLKPDYNPYAKVPQGLLSQVVDDEVRP